LENAYGYGQIEVKTLFTDSEKKLISDFIEDLEGSSINGKEITCMKSIFSLVKRETDKISESICADYIEQVQLLKDWYEAIGITDSSLFDKIILFLESSREL